MHLVPAHHSLQTSILCTNDGAFVVRQASSPRRAVVSRLPAPHPSIQTSFLPLFPRIWGTCQFFRYEFFLSRHLYYLRGSLSSCKVATGWRDNRFQVASINFTGECPPERKCFESKPHTQTNWNYTRRSSGRGSFSASFETSRTSCPASRAYAMKLVASCVGLCARKCRSSAGYMPTSQLKRPKTHLTVWNGPPLEPK